MAERRPPKTTDWEPSDRDAINIAALRTYILSIEHLALVIYRSDPPKDRPHFKKLEEIGRLPEESP